ncbi:sugar transferase [Aliamphritea hakodatensis]|uniref:sugar transferase n=1 Tax=Aliamphritea hakodatensis TaxID=2895352 RepID=UPI0022FD39B1|nr:sugar transferase [Aliamphritea hakodatensis]
MNMTINTTSRSATPATVRTHQASYSALNSYVPKTVLLAKRAMDIAVAATGLLACAFLLPVIALAIKLDSPGPVIFRQLRIGHAEASFTHLFWMYKFRTMRVDAEAASGAVWATKGDPRVTALGRFLRKTRLDELPQLFNVLRGDMSLIGPRPERPGFYQKLETAIPFFAERTFGLKPGITGLAQVNQGYDRDIEDVRSKVGYDHAYALSLSSFITWLSTDLRIMVQTVAVMVCGRGQ